jgi:hypothetical protein
VTAFGGGADHVADDLVGAGPVGDQVPVDRGDPAWCGRVLLTGVPEAGAVQVQHRLRPWLLVSAGGEGQLGCAAVTAGRSDCVGEGVSDRAELQGDQVVQLVPSVGRGGEPEPAAGGDLLDGVLERGGGNVVALVDDDEPVPGGQGSDVVAAGQGLQHGDVDDAAGLGPAAAELAGLDAEQVADPGAPLVGQCLAVDQHQGGGHVSGDGRTGDHSLARPWGRDEHAEVVPDDRVQRGLLLRGQGCGEGELLSGTGHPFVVTTSVLPACSASEVTVLARPRGSTSAPSIVSS